MKETLIQGRWSLIVCLCMRLSIGGSNQSVKERGGGGGWREETRKETRVFCLFSFWCDINIMTTLGAKRKITDYRCCLWKTYHPSMQFHTDFHSNLLCDVFVHSLNKINTFFHSLHSIDHRDYVMKCSKLSSETAQLWLVVPLQF